MQILGYLCLLLLTICSGLEFCWRFCVCSLGVMMMDCVTFLKHFYFGFGFFVFGGFRHVFMLLLGLFFLFGMGFKFLQFSWFCKGLNTTPRNFSGKSSELRSGFRSKYGACKRRVSRSLRNYNAPSKIDVLEQKTRGSESDGAYNEEEEEEEEEEEWYDEDKVFEVLALRKMVKSERRKAECAHLELEKERMAAASAAQEAMAMILRLQNEKSMIEMESRQYKRLAEEKQLHDQEVIQSLQWLVLKHESESATFLEDQLRLHRKRSKLFMRNDEEGDHSEDDELSWNSPWLFSSLDLDLSPE